MSQVDTRLEKNIITLEGGAVYDVLIIGAGPAGITAATLAFQRGLSVLLIEEAVLCGNVYNIPEVEDAVFFREVRPLGKDIAPYFSQNITRFPLDVVYERVSAVKLEGPIKTVITAHHTYWGRSVILATGTKIKQATVANSEQFYGHGVSYCAVCDVGYYFQKPVMIVGTGENMAKMALFLSEGGSQVAFVSPTDRIDASATIRTRLAGHSKISGYYGYKIIELKGDHKLESVVLESSDKQKTITVKAEALFIYEGIQANTDFLANDQLELTHEGFVRANALMETTVSGVFAIGSVRDNPRRRIVYGMSDAMTAIDQIETYLYFLA